MAVETAQAIIAYLSTRLKTDATLLSVLGDPFAVYRIMGPDDPDFPYFRHKLVVDGNLFDGVHLYLLDLWWYGENSATPDLAIDRIKILLHEHRYTTAYDEATGTINWASGDYEDDTGNVVVWHWASRWHLKIGAARDTTNIVG